jgi:uncharacterized protein (DUF2147 family)
VSPQQLSLLGAIAENRTAFKNLGRTCAGLLLATLCLLSRAPAQSAPTPVSPSSLPSPVGQWKTVDDVTGQIKSIVQIREQDGVLYGTVVEVFNPPAPHPLCIHCPGAFKDRPVVGLEILWGLRKSGADKSGPEWTGGQVLDPENGKIYRCNLTLADNGQTLRLRGFIGFSLFGRTQRWLRVARPDRNP